MASKDKTVMELKARKGPAGMSQDRWAERKPAKKKKTPPGYDPDGVVEC